MVMQFATAQDSPGRRDKVNLSLNLKQSLARRLSSLGKSSPGPEHPAKDSISDGLTSTLAVPAPAARLTGSQPSSPRVARTPGEAKIRQRTASSSLSINVEQLGLSNHHNKTVPSPIAAVASSHEPASPKSRATSFGTYTRRSSSPLPETHPAFGMPGLSSGILTSNLMTGLPSPTTTLANKSSAASSTVLNSPTISTPPTSAGLISSGHHGMPSTPRSNVSEVLDHPETPTQLLDMMHPCIPFPRAWNSQHDQYIVWMDIQDYHYSAIVAQIKRKFPSLTGALITPNMVEQRLVILDSNPRCDYFKRAIELIKEQTKLKRMKQRERSWMDAITEVENSGKMDLEERTSSRTQPASAQSPGKANQTNHTRKLNPAERRAKSVSNGGLGEHVIVARGKASLVDTSRPTSPCSARATPQSSMLLSTNTSEDMYPRPSPNSRTPRSSKGKGKANIKPSGFENEPYSSDDGDLFGVPRVMRKSSGKPVLR